MSPTTSIPRVAVWVETSRGYGRGLIRGIADYVREHDPWSIYFTPHGLHDPLPEWLRKWRGDGILARVENRRMARLLLGTQLPLIDLSCRLPEFQSPFLGIDNRPVAQMAFEHLRERGFRHYGFFGTPHGQHYNMDRRCEYFSHWVDEAGFPCHVFEVRRVRNKSLSENCQGSPCGQHDMEPPRGFRTDSKIPNWESYQRQLGKWLLGLPKPIGIMCCNDDHGLQLLDACRRVEVAVPDQVAVIGVDNDEELCRLATHPLSSIDLNSQRFGYRAAALLNEMMATGILRHTHDIAFPPSHVVTRLSTDTMAVDDPTLARALRFIRDHACERISVNHVVKAAITSRRHLERLMETHLGRSPNQEILRVRIRRAQELLCETTLSLEAIAGHCGFPSRKYMGDVFVRETGQPPGQFRDQTRDYHD